MDRNKTHKCSKVTRPTSHPSHTREIAPLAVPPGPPRPHSRWVWPTSRLFRRHLDRRTANSAVGGHQSIAPFCSPSAPCARGRCLRLPSPPPTVLGPSSRYQPTSRSRLPSAMPPSTGRQGAPRRRRRGGRAAEADDLSPRARRAMGREERSGAQEAARPARGAIGPTRARCGEESVQAAGELGRRLGCASPLGGSRSRAGQKRLWRNVT